MKALLRKEFRDSLRPGVLGLVICGLLLLNQFLQYETEMRLLALERLDASRVNLQPLDGLQEPIAFFFAIFAAVLGWVQVFTERHGGLWGFLMHRPMTPAWIFLAKTIAGLGVYLVAAGLPLVCFIGWAITPGNVAAPFKWSGLLPLLLFYLAGIPYYFAGMLTGLRQARWYASRTLGLGAGLLLSLSLVFAPHFWQALLLLLLGTGFLGLAAWGSFHTNGYYRSQPAAGKQALTLTLALGAVVVAFFVGVLLADLVGRVVPKVPQSPWSNYRMTKDGKVFKVTRTKNQPLQIADLDGNPVKDPRTGAPMTNPELERVTCWPVHAYANFEKEPRPGSWYFAHDRFPHLWQATPQTLWYYDPVRGRLVGYDVATRRPIGSLGPKGFAPDLVGAGDAFTGALERSLRTETALYLPDFQNRSVKQFFSTESQDAIVGADDVVRNEHDWTYTLILTRQFVRLLTPDGTEVLKAPFQPAPPDYCFVELSLLEPAGEFALWIKPSYQANEKAGGKLPTHVTWFDGGRKTASTELPPLSREHTPSHIEEKVIGLLMPPGLIAILPLIRDTFPAEDDTQTWLLWRILLFASLAFSVVVCLPAGYWLTIRYSLPGGVRLGWAVFLLAFGFPGLLALLSVEEWPAREPCPNCRKLRIVCRERCEHCGAEFPAPEKKGTEIFDPSCPAMPT